MAVYDSSRMQYQPSVLAGLISRIALFGVNALIATRDAVVAWNDARVTRSSLSRLSDRELEDIGLCRGDIEAVATQR